MTDVAPDQVPDGWSDGASSYRDNFGVLTRAFAADAVRLARVDVESDVLDVAAGTGEASAAARAAGGRVTSTDFAEGMVRELEQRFAGDDGVTVMQMDGQHLTFADASFDVGISMFGLMFFPDAAQGLRELHRVLRPGGRVAIGVWTRDFSVSRHIAEALRRVLPTPPPLRPPTWAPFADNLVDNLRGAGFLDVEVHEVMHHWDFTDPAAFFRTTRDWSPPLRMMLEALDEATYDLAAEAFAESVTAAGGLDAMAPIAIGVR
ncbi:MAG TPA: methyltransferase domain-containing protein [Acidimicrobiales bacterium]|nr:methyltransferase domain-containing protein [Acidimicrobiales bacterium]